MNQNDLEDAQNRVKWKNLTKSPDPRIWRQKKRCTGMGWERPNVWTSKPWNAAGQMLGKKSISRVYSAKRMEYTSSLLCGSIYFTPDEGAGKRILRNGCLPKYKFNPSCSETSSIIWTKKPSARSVSCFSQKDVNFLPIDSGQYMLTLHLSW